MAKETKAALERTNLDVIADRGYFSSEEILECDEAGITVTLPKPMILNPNILKVAYCFNLKRLRNVAMNCRDHFRLCRNRHFNFVGSVGLAKVACAKRIKAN